MAELKTKPTAVAAAAFLDAVEPAPRREDAKALAILMARISGTPPVMWGPSIVGFDNYHYRYESGHQGEMCRIGFSPRKAELVLYVLSEGAEQDALLARLGRHRTGKSCLYIRNLADVDMTVLESLIRIALERSRSKYP